MIKRKNKKIKKISLTTLLLKLEKPLEKNGTNAWKQIR